MSPLRTGTQTRTWEGRVLGDGGDEGCATRLLFGQVEFWGGWWE